jgi:hypothetical protein
MDQRADDIRQAITSRRTALYNKLQTLEASGQ